MTLDLSTIPLEKVLKLLEDHREAHQAYIRSLRGDFWSNGIGTFPGHFAFVGGADAVGTQ